jgi:hypothetical protein
MPLRACRVQSGSQHVASEADTLEGTVSVVTGRRSLATAACPGGPGESLRFLAAMRANARYSSYCSLVRYLTPSHGGSSSPSFNLVSASAEVSGMAEQTRSVDETVSAGGSAWHNIAIRGNLA